MIFYKITKAQASVIGSFEYAKNCVFEPFCSEQIDGTYLVSVDLIAELSENENIKQVDWSELEIINSNQINTKKIIL